MQSHRYRSSSLGGCVGLSGLQRLGLALLLGFLLFSGGIFCQPLTAQAASNSPVIHWDQSMIFPGANNGNPWGPVGEEAVVHGEKFAPNLAINLVVVAGDVNTNPALCVASTPGKSVQVAQLTTDASGSFQENFDWPAGVGQVGQTRANSICALKASDSQPVGSLDDGPFTVLSDNQPTLNVSASTVSAGQTVTVSGQYWVPPQPLTLTIANCADCDPGKSLIVSLGTTSKGLNTGTFSVNVKIPATAQAGQYVINAVSQNGALDAYHVGGIPSLTVTEAQITPTPTAGLTPTVTAAATQTAVATPTATSGMAGQGDSNGGNSNLLIIVVVAIIIVILAIVALLIFVMLQRNKAASPSGTVQTPGTPAGAAQFQQANNAMMPFPANTPMGSSAQFGSSPNSNFAQANQPMGQPYQQPLAQTPVWPGNQQWNNGAPQQWGSNQAQWNAGNSQWNSSNPQQWNNPAPWDASNQPWSGNQANASGNLQSAQAWPGSVGSGSGNLAQRRCMRCGTPLEPDSVICGNCGLRHAPISNPNDPTVAF